MTIRFWRIMVTALIFLLPWSARGASVDKGVLFESLKDADFFKRAQARLEIWNKLPSERAHLGELLTTDLKNSAENTRVEAALFLRKFYPEKKEVILEAMEKDPDVNVRVRLARRLLADHKDERGRAVLKDTIKASNIRTHKGAEIAMRAADGLRAASGEIGGGNEALEILAAPSDWFLDIQGSSNEYSLRGSVKTMAAAHVLAAKDEVPKEKAMSAFRAHLREVKQRRSSSNGKERGYWEQDIPNILDMTQRAGMNELALENQDAIELIDDKNGKERMRRIINEAKKYKK